METQRFDEIFLFNTKCCVSKNIQYWSRIKYNMQNSPNSDVFAESIEFVACFRVYRAKKIHGGKWGGGKSWAVDPLAVVKHKPTPYTHPNARIEYAYLARCKSKLRDRKKKVINLRLFIIQWYGPKEPLPLLPHKLEQNLWLAK